MAKILISIATAAAALAVSMPASAAVTIVNASSGQGTLVHGTGSLQEGFTVTGNLGAGGPNIVNFTGDTTETANASDRLRMQQGQGQADVTGAEITLGGPANDLYNILSGNIFLTGNVAMSYIEFALTSTIRGTVDFIITGSDGTSSFLNQIIGTGDTHFAFNTTGNSTMTNIRFVADSPLQFTTLKQVRLDRAPGAVPEPATWAMMLIGFAGVGAGLRRSRKQQNGRLRQIA